MKNEGFEPPNIWLITPKNEGLWVPMVPTWKGGDLLKRDDPPFLGSAGHLLEGWHRLTHQGRKFIQLHQGLRNFTKVKGCFNTPNWNTPRAPRPLPIGYIYIYIYEPWSKVAILGMVIPPLIGNPYNGYLNPYYWVDDHPLLYGNIGSLDPGTYKPGFISLCWRVPGGLPFRTVCENSGCGT